MMREQRGIFIPEQDKAIIWGKNFEKKEYDKIKPRGYRALDIGAHVGIWTRRLAIDFTEVIAFEPMPKHIECHKKNCEGLDNVVLNEIALSNINGTRIMTTKDNNSGMSTLIDTKDLHWRLPKTIMPVVTQTLDSWNFPKMDFIKMDVEGWEEQVLRGGMNTILKYKPRMYIEIWPKKYEIISDILEREMGYTLTPINSYNYICEPEKVQFSPIERISNSPKL
jgi:FkbM family methyltransferase